MNAIYVVFRRGVLGVCFIVLFSHSTLAQYHPFDTTLALVDRLVTEYPAIIKKYSYGTSVQGRELFAVKISDNVNINEMEPEIGFDGGTHGNEIPGQEMVIWFMNELVTQYGADTLITRLVNSREIWIYPHVNPDGQVNNTRTNAKNVNINRDWGYWWNADEGSKVPLSQPETKASARWFLENHFTIVQSNHDGVQMVLYPWAIRPNTIDERPLFEALASVYSNYTGYRQGQWYSTLYQSSGACVDFFYGARGAVAFVVEVSSNKNPGPDAIAPIYAKNRLGMLHFVEQAGHGLTGTITDSVSGKSIQGRLQVIWNGLESFPYYNDPTIGDYHKFVSPGSYTVSVAANGYVTKSFSGVTVTDGAATPLDFRLRSAQDVNVYGQQVVFCRIPGIEPNAALFKDEGITHKALGIPDGRKYSIGKGGFIVVDLGDTIHDVTGPDLRIFEGDDIAESYSVRVSLSMWDSLPTWKEIGNGTGTASFDISGKGVTAFRYVYIIDDNDDDLYAENAGFDLDAVMGIKVPDVFLPTTPELLSATPGFNDVRLTWSASIDNDNGIAQYMIYRDNVLIGRTMNVSYLDDSIPDNTEYEYFVKAVNYQGLLSEASNALQTKTLKDTTRPSLTIVNADAGQYRIDVVYSEAVEKTAAENIANYSLSANLPIDSVVLLEDGVTAQLYLSENMIDGWTYSLIVSNIPDRAYTPNTIMPNSEITFAFKLGLSLYLSLDENSGDTAHDQSVNVNHGVLVNSPIRSAGVRGNALSFDSSSYVTVANSPSLNFGKSNFSIALWVKFDTLYSKQVIIDKTNGTSGYRLMTSSSDPYKLMFIRGGAYGDGISSSSAVFVPGKWTHVAVVVANNTVSIYVDGVSKGSGTLKDVDASTTTALFIGRKGYSSSSALPFKGMMDDIRIYNRLITNNEVIALSDSTKAVTLSENTIASNLIEISTSPNPFNASVRIMVNHQSPGKLQNDVSVEIFSIDGKRVGRLPATEMKSSGKSHKRSFYWNASEAASGIYFAIVKADGKSVLRRMILVK
ncbi:MAG: T9SS type A sorting domain-containing protein [Fibrobacteres bacterium]|nr:T9SS type A sorting domain-containing protein [Fibrobacterota bacterium]